MAHIPSQEPYLHPYSYVPAPPRISGTAMPHGVFLSTGTASTASALSLVVTGLFIVTLGAFSLVPTYMVAWTIEQLIHVPLAAVVLQIGGPADPVTAALAHMGVNVLSFLMFLVVLRASPLAGYHAAEHMTVHAIEHFGVQGWQEHVEAMPRAHLRCGSNLLSGILPALLLGAPLLAVAPPVALLVALGGWYTRRRLGFFLQNYFTTKPPSRRQREAGIAAGESVLRQWLADPAPTMSRARAMWLRGMPQMVMGVAAAVWILEPLVQRLHLWLDW